MSNSESSTNNKGTVYAVVVTHNRKGVLKRCLHALLSQTYALDSIIIADNASTDGTEDMLRNEFLQNPLFIYINMVKNLGGGGGFHFGAKCAFEKGADWIWLMDDDCLPDQNCLKNLMSNIDSSSNVYSPVMLSLEDRKTVLWGLKGKTRTGNQSVCPLPFNGFLIHRKLIKKIGYPDKDFFIYGDDTDYSLRVISSGSRLIMVTDSILYHPYRNMIKEFNIIKMFLNKLWVYYKLRNAIIIYKRHNYVSINQIVMFMSAFLFYIVTLRFDFIKLWIEGLKDGLNSRLYVRDFTT